MKKELEAYLDKQGWYLSAEKALDLTEQVLIFLADKTEKEEPGAFNSIRYLKEARTEVALALNGEEEE
jgi:hypothetical protein